MCPLSRSGEPLSLSLTRQLKNAEGVLVVVHERKLTGSYRRHEGLRAACPCQHQTACRCELHLRIRFCLSKTPRVLMPRRAGAAAHGARYRENSTTSAYPIPLDIPDNRTPFFDAAAAARALRYLYFLSRVRIPKVRRLQGFSSTCGARPAAYPCVHNSCRAQGRTEQSSRPLYLLRG